MGFKFLPTRTVLLFVNGHLFPGEKAMLVPASDTLRSQEVSLSRTQEPGVQALLHHCGPIRTTHY